MKVGKKASPWCLFSDVNPGEAFTATGFDRVWMRVVDDPAGAKVNAVALETGQLGTFPLDRPVTRVDAEVVING